MLDKTLKEVLHETAQDLHEAGVMNKQTMREFDVMCLPPIKNYTPKQIKRIRERNHVSQTVFAAYLNTTPSTIQKWEQGQKKPSNLALKLLSLVDHHSLVFLAA